MAMTRAARLARTVPVKVTFENGDELNVESRKSGRGYGQVKELLDISREARRMTTRSAKLKRDLERDGVSDDQKTEIKSEIEDLDEKSEQSAEAMIDWMAGNAERPGAIADWDYFEDEGQTQKVAITHERLKEFEAGEIVVLASAILEKMNVGESKPAS